MIFKGRTNHRLHKINPYYCYKEEFPQLYLYMVVIMDIESSWSFEVQIAYASYCNSIPGCARGNGSRD